MPAWLPTSIFSTIKAWLVCSRFGIIFHYRGPWSVAGCRLDADLQSRFFGTSMFPLRLNRKDQNTPEESHTSSTIQVEKPNVPNNLKLLSHRYTSILSTILMKIDGRQTFPAPCLRRDMGHGCHHLLPYHHSPTLNSVKTKIF